MNEVKDSAVTVMNVLILHQYRIQRIVINYSGNKTNQEINYYKLIIS
jgi:hypothetical protein